jgi:hypothetical protein
MTGPMALFGEILALIWCTGNTGRDLKKRKKKIMKAKE